jgi:exodeoxyribonuclease VII small subunit
MSSEDQPEPKPAQLSFEHALAELEAIVAQLEEGQIPLAESLARYEQGVKLLRQCYQILENTERKIELLNRVDSDGQAHSEPFDDRDVSLEEKAQARSRRRSRGSPSNQQSSSENVDESGQLF